MFRATIIAALLVTASLISVLNARGQGGDVVLQRLEITFYTDEDDKDEPDEVTVQVVRAGDGKIMGEWKGGKGTKWDNRTENTFTLNLRDPIKYNDRFKFTLHVALNSPDKNGWHMHVRRTIGLTDAANKHTLRNKDSDGTWFGNHKGIHAPFQNDFDLSTQ